MNVASKITAKGQTTIPLEVREMLGLRAGDRVQYVTIGDRVQMVARNRPVNELFGALQHYAIPGTTLQDYKNAIAEGLSARQVATVSQSSQTS